jgi:hypothetical protein
MTPFRLLLLLIFGGQYIINLALYQRFLSFVKPLPNKKVENLMLNLLNYNKSAKVFSRVSELKNGEEKIKTKQKMD